MEDSSHELIDQLNAEQKHCYGFDNQSNSIPNVSTTLVPENNREQQQMHFPVVGASNKKISEANVPEEIAYKEAQITTAIIETESSSFGNAAKKVKIKKERASVILPPLTHNQRWSEEEDRHLNEAIELYGYGHWKSIAEHVKTRNSLQCKNRGRQKLVNSQQKKKAIPERDNNTNSVTFVNATPNLSSSDTTSSSKVYKAPITPPSDAANESESSKSMYFSNSNNIAEKALLQSPPICQSFLTSQTGPSSKVENAAVSEESILAAELEAEFEVNQNEISDDERLQNAEWFVVGKPAKTPERYLRIRNHIINCWKKSKPSYLTKTAGRKNLADCGDVNAVGRIHAYLESINAINVNCASPVKRVSGRSSANRFDENGMPRMKKAKKTPGYFWADVDNNEEESDQVDSVIIKRDGKSRPKRAAKKPETFYNEGGNGFGQGSDPFTLVPVGYYPNERSAPFTVDITSNALLVMDFHSHLAYTEIIGLLGGRVVHNEDGSQKLTVEYVFPCRSTSTGIQCEMDPVSEMAAREVFEQKGLNVVGWYHSHPTFEPEPSIRDIENQASYQDLFRDDNSGIEPFIGVIITPYNSRNLVSDKSQFQFIHISNRWSANGAYRLPFACYQKVTQCKSLPQDMFEMFESLINEYRSYEHKIDMKLQYGQVTRLDKLMRSLKSHLFMEPEENNEKFLSDLRHMIQRTFDNNSMQNSILNQESRQKQMDNVINSLAI